MRRMGGEASYLRLSWCCPKELRGKVPLTNKYVEIRHKQRTVLTTPGICVHTFVACLLRGMATSLGMVAVDKEGVECIKEEFCSL